MKQKLTCTCGGDEFNRVHELHMDPDGTAELPEGPIGKLLSISCRKCNKVYTLDDFVSVYDIMDSEQGLYLKTLDED